MAAYGASCQPAANFPDPNRRSGGPVAPPAASRIPRRRTLFSRRLYRISAALQDPLSITLREAVVALFALFALYRASFVAARMYELLAVRDVGELCQGNSALGCILRYLRTFWTLGYGWAGVVVPWGFVVAVGVFLGEEAIGAFRKKGRS